MQEESHPSRVRGLKYDACQGRRIDVGSHPSRVRGLKYDERNRPRIYQRSHPSRVRGLKFQILNLGSIDQGRTLRGCVD